MPRLDPKKLHVEYLPVTDPERLFPRRYTLTHSDFSGDLFLTIGADYNRKQISGLYTRLMRDEVLAEWRIEEEKPSLHVHVVVSARMAFGTASWRESILRSEMPLVLEAIRCGDQRYLDAHPDLDSSTIYVHFGARGKPDRVEPWGTMGSYKAQG